MKVRIGFVSNSSTSSFVLGKAYMKAEQIIQFREWIAANENEWHEGYIGETEYYFQGDFSQHYEGDVRLFLESILVNPKYIGDYC